MSGVIPHPSLYIFMTWTGKPVLGFDVINVDCTMSTVVLHGVVFITSSIRCSCCGLCPVRCGAAWWFAFPGFTPAILSESSSRSLAIGYAAKSVHFHDVADHKLRISSPRDSLRFLEVASGWSASIYLHIPLSDIQSKECCLASLVEMSGGWTTGKWGVNSRQLQRKSFYSTQTGSGIRPASC